MPDGVKNLLCVAYFIYHYFFKFIIYFVSLRFVQMDIHPVCHVGPAPGGQGGRPLLALPLHPLGVLPVPGGQGAPPE